MRPIRVLGLALGIVLGGAGAAGARSLSAPEIPLTFEANAGQTNPEAKFIARGTGYGTFLTPTAIVLGLSPQKDAAPVALRLAFAGARASSTLTGVDELPGRANYFSGNDPARWRRGVATFARVRAREVWRGIDVVYYGTGSRLEFDFVVAPGADPRVIALAVEGADAIELGAGGEIVITAAGRTLRLQKPTVYQDVDGVRREVAGGYRIDGERRVRFHVAAYDAARPLVIDPVLNYSSYLGGSAYDSGSAVAVDGAGFVYLTGHTFSANFPILGAMQPTRQGFIDVFVTKLAPDGGIVYSTYLGGTVIQSGLGIAADRRGHAYVTGMTSSPDFPMLNAIQPALNGSSDAFVTRLDTKGGLVYSTYLGGSASEVGTAIGVDGSGSAIVTGTTFSKDFPIQGAVQAAFGGQSDAFVTRLDPKGASFIYSTFLGGSAEDEGRDIAVDGDGAAYVTGNTRSWDFPLALPVQGTPGGGYDAFVTKLSPSGAVLLYSTFLGGSGPDVGYGIAIDAVGNAYVVGETESLNFPTVAAMQAGRLGPSDAFVAKLDRTGGTLLYSTYLGGNWYDAAFGVAVDARGSAYVVGYTGSTNFPSVNAVQPTYGAGGRDAFAAKLNPAGSALAYSTYLGGSGFDIALRVGLDSERNTWVVGATDSTNFPTTLNAVQPSNAGGNDAFALRLTDVLAYVGTHGGPLLWSLDLATNTPAGSTLLGSGPRGMALTPDGTLAFVADDILDAALVVDTRNPAAVGIIPVGSMPEAVAVSPDGRLAYVTNLASASVSVIDVATRAVVQTVPVGLWPVGVALGPDGTAYVANAGEDTVSVLRLVHVLWFHFVAEVARIPVGSIPYGVAASPHGFAVYVSNLGSNSVSVIDPGSLTEVARVPVGVAPRGVAMSPRGTRAYVVNSGSNSVSVLETITHGVLATIPVGSGPEGVAVTPGGTRVYVTNYNSASVSVIDTVTNTVVATRTVGPNPHGVAVTP